MPKIQGKQIANGTITQGNLGLVTPASGDTNYAATVGYVNDYVSTHSGTIGPAEDGDYSDGIFTDFTKETPIGTAVDRFNEMFLKLAPTPPSSNWTNVFSGLALNSTYSAKILGTTTTATNIVNTTTPTYSLTDTVGTGVNAKALPSSPNELVFTLSDSYNGVLETETITSTSTTNLSGRIQYTVGDPYAGESGKAGFWTGITAFNVLNDTLPTIPAGDTQRVLTFSHPGTDSPETLNFYVNNAVSPSVGSISGTFPSMTRYISGVPSLKGGDVITNVTFTATNAVSYFYNASFYDFTGTLINSSTANPPTVPPTTYGEIVTISGKTATITNSPIYSDTSASFTITVRSANNSSGTGTLTSTVHRIDTVSNESIRITSGNGSYPSTGYGDSFDSLKSLVEENTEELMLKNGVYQYPNGNYTAFGGPNYSTATGTRWVTFNLGTFTNNSAFTLNFIGSNGITSIYGQANLLVEVKIDGASYWVDGDAAYSGTGNPGSTVDGVAAVVVGSSTATSRRITFGSITYTGNIIVRVGLTGSGVTFTGLTASSIV